MTDIVERKCSRCKRRPPAERRNLCQKCLDNANKSRLKRNAELLAAGICVTCKTNPNSSPRQTCDSCAKNESESALRRARKNISSGLCASCGKPKDKDGWYCLECYQKNLENGMRWKIENHDKKIEQDRIYWCSHRKEATERMRRWRENNRDRLNEYARQYRASLMSSPDSAERVRLRWATRNSRVRTNGESFTVDEWKALLEKYNYTCLGCGKTDLKLTVDHVIPLLFGGKNTIDNIQPLCGSCNSSKRTKTIDYRVRYDSVMEWT